MATSRNPAMARAETRLRRGLVRTALTGVTPQLILLIAALLLARMLSSTIGDFFIHLHAHALGAWFLGFLANFGQLLAQAAPMVVGIVVAANLGPQQGWQRAVTLTIAVVLSTGVGVLVRIVIAEAIGIGAGWHEARNMVPYVWTRYAILAAMVTVAGEFYRRKVVSVAVMQRALLERAALEREMAEARLQVLQAQIEPHFLFNSLANVRRLYVTNHRAGREMLEKLMRYLEVALPRIREGTTTLGGDAALIEAFLHVQQVRMGPRLEFSVDIAPSLRAHPIPPMMLLTLVENAIKHGVNPSQRGGFVRVGAHVDGDRLVLAVADTGVGFPQGSGGGTGLANIRARLLTQFGPQASLVLDHNDLGGVTATISLPRAAMI